MAQKIGIPRALLYYKYFPMWADFLRRLGADIVVSGCTSQETVSRGASRVVSDTCLPVKVFIGHVIALSEQCDSILIPVVRSTEKKVLNCSRFLGLPDVTRAVVPEAPPILEIEFDVNRGRRFLYQQIYSLGRRFSRSPFKIRDAARHAWATHLWYQQVMVHRGLTRAEAIELLEHSPREHMPLPHVAAQRPALTIGLAGHPYILYDEQISHRVISRLRAQGIKVVTPEMLQKSPADGRAEAAVGDIPSRYWESEEDMVDAGNAYCAGGVDGIIGMMAFGCGPDSLMMYLVQHQAQAAGIPFMSLTVEEHTAEAGILTRLEAFVDMIHRRKKRAV